MTDITIYTTDKDNRFKDNRIQDRYRVLSDDV